MIEQAATVVTVNQGHITVESQRATACGTCASGGGCGIGVLGRLFGNRSSRIEVTADMAVQPGDEVVIGVPEDALLLGSLWLYLVPLLLFIAGSLVGRTVAINTGGGELLAVVGAILGGLAGFVWAAAHTRTRDSDPAFRPVVLQRTTPGSIAVPPPPT
ncbi:MAG: SoxR reducing system RseC family protein [Gammaproteobacteria bacterium]|nr:SoxR reducing system RseC family protein [Gammaproteobacteria bacterium]